MIREGTWMISRSFIWIHPNPPDVAATARRRQRDRVGEL
jgi:hypothetical protein